jgi:small subunit ribosomal protein S3
MEPDGRLLEWLRGEHPDKGIARVLRGRDGEGTVVEIHTGSPGLIIGRRAAGLVALKEALEADLGPLKLNLIEIRRAEREPLLVADRVLLNVSRGVDPERALARCVAQALRAGARACRVRLDGGAEGAIEREGFAEGEGIEALAGVTPARAERGRYLCEVEIG